ncbi:MAG: hypothetical protein Q9222_003422 [Ikaeria aurantiellina]
MTSTNDFVGDYKSKVAKSTTGSQIYSELQASNRQLSAKVKTLEKAKFDISMKFLSQEKANIEQEKSSLILAKEERQRCETLQARSAEELTRCKMIMADLMLEKDKLAAQLVEAKQRKAL